MNRKFRRTLRQLIAPMVGCTLVVYFAYHLMQGHYGILSWRHLNHQLDEAKEKQLLTTQEYHKIAHQVRLLRPDGLDLDMLEERVRAVLNYTRATDYVILRQDPSLGAERK